MSAKQAPKMCTLCHSGFDEPCTTCAICMGRDCPVVVGECGCKFHKHCIEGYLGNKRTNCPGCNAKWAIAK
ncbi:hypothetical protein TVAG_297070 [Trichomonas vaginalis G3]|uniref:RING-type domain-containing protein n=1 Tax=Trichomonas vaginalis (strain ATCC PRA-98 / G3) TaxID=412133 RepID=A2DRA2_TRIV3|nr:zinc finger, RING/FYVE/PHD-type domain-containing protein [Trichomonas vaginalis G3]EAY17028.1 hypothetical protein TVAG_297070 [Trichomonas vaginalis G3]KAI5517891.1 zinc finger, RING/FYVE/PHD-type domain-containing protein [Trichomonas vaginalis G3]|eukprot:XP_001329251.1 hypothetical protein [Trichomonas vaginalis G3]